ncbi:26271_t:CDS:2, partial [Racocetra persica]
ILNDPKNTSISNPNIRHHVKNNYSSQKISGIVTLMHKKKSSNNWKPLLYKQVSDKYHAIKPIISKFFIQRLQIDLIDMRTRRDGKFKWIAHARDHFSHFSWGHILTDKYAAKVAVFLFDIFTVFELLIFLQSDNGCEFTADIINNLSKLWPNLKIIHGKPRRLQTQGSVERANF